MTQHDRSRPEPIDTSLLELAAALRHADTRADAARELAMALGAEVSLVFVRDEEVDALLPAPGFPQTLPDGKLWQSFLGASVQNGHAVATLRLRAGNEPLHAQSYSADRNAVFVLLGGDPGERDMSWLRALLPLLSATFRNEQLAAQAQLQMRIARESSVRNATLARVLEGARSRLESVLQESREARDAMEAQAMELEMQADELRASNNALAGARLTAEKANRAKSEFLATMSHELRTPLNAIGGHAQLLEMELHGSLNEQQLHAVGRIVHGQLHLLGLINDILNLSRIEAGRVEYHSTEVSLGPVVADVSSLLEPQLLTKSLDLEVLEPEQLPTVHADREKLQQILLNLLFNAVKFTEPGGRIWIEARGEEQQPGAAVLRVSDSGCGIDAEKLNMIFEPFTQIRAELTRTQDGTGLGLAISRDLARGMGGELSVESVVGQGSSFILAIPRTYASRRAISQSAPSAAAGQDAP